MKKAALIIVASLGFYSFTTLLTAKQLFTNKEVISSSLTLLNDTKETVSVHTGSGFVTLQKGSKTTISCNVGKEISWAESGKKKGVIFKISNDMCGETVKLSDYK
jgi:hypothetical protein